VSPPFPSSWTVPSLVCAVMTDSTMDIEKSPDSREASEDVIETRGPHYYVDGVPRNKGVFGRVRFPLPWNSPGF